MGNSKNLPVFNFAILLKSWKLRKFDAREIYMFYSIKFLIVNLQNWQSLGSNSVVYILCGIWVL